MNGWVGPALEQSVLQCVSFLVIYTQNPGRLGVASGSKAESAPGECVDVIGASAM